MKRIKAYRFGFEIKDIMKRVELSRLAPLFVILAASLWGIDGIILRPSLYHLPVAVVVFIETGIAAFILTPFFVRQFKSLKLVKSKDLLAFLGVAIFGGAIGTMAITKALFYVDYVNLSIVVLIQKLQPVFAIILAALLLKERLSKRFFFYAALAIAGAYLMTFGLSLPNINSNDKTAIAALFAFIATLGFSTSTVLSKRALRNVEFHLGSYLRIAITTVIMFIIVLSRNEFSMVFEITSEQLFVFLLIVFSTGGPAMFLYFYGLKKISASVATICELAFPLTAVLLEYTLRGNTLNWLQWLGVIILLGSIIRVSVINSKKQKTGNR